MWVGKFDSRIGAGQSEENHVAGSACGNGTIWTGLFADGAPEETIIALFAAKGAHENQR
jgi:hypothetical protein